MTPHESKTTLNRALAHYTAGRPEQASELLSLIPETAPCHPDALHWLGVIIFKQHRREEGLALIRRSHHLAPTRPDFLQNLGAFCHRDGRLDEAVAAFRLALTLAPENADAHSALGLALLDQGHTDDAVAHARRAVEVRPGFVHGLINLGVALREQGRVREALACYDEAIALKPDFAHAHKNRAFCLLLLGDFATGWAEHEWRLNSPGARPRHADIPRWDGSRLRPEDTLLIHAEQGFGDTLHFFRHVETARHRAGDAGVVLECQSPLRRLLADNAGPRTEVVAATGESRAAARQSPLMSLPFTLRDFGPGSYPKKAYLRANPQLRREWAARFAPDSRLRVGLAWAGNPANPNDRNRSITAESLLPLLEIPDVSYHNLQVGAGRDGAERLVAAGLSDETRHISDFADTAALMTHLDLVISVDTAVAHLAGALGVPVWTLVPVVPDWRWGLEAEDTPLYPSMRLFRQTRRGQWSDVIDRIRLALRDMAEHRARHPDSACHRRPLSD